MAHSPRFNLQRSTSFNCRSPDYIMLLVAGTWQLCIGTKNVKFRPVCEYHPPGGPRISAGGGAPPKGPAGPQMETPVWCSNVFIFLAMTNYLIPLCKSVHLITLNMETLLPPQRKKNQTTLYQVLLGAYASKSDLLPGAGRQNLHVLPYFRAAHLPIQKNQLRRPHALL